MRRLLILPLVLLSAAPASAKEIERATVCGRDHCVPVTGAGVSVAGGSDTAAPAAPEDFVGLRVRMDGDTITLRFLPQSGVSLAGDGTWYQPDPVTVQALRDAAARVDPRPASAIADAFPRAQAPPTATVPDDGDGPGWVLYAGLAAAALFVALALIGGRRRPAAAP